MSVMYVCAICGYSSDARQEFVEFKDPVNLRRAVEKAKGKGRTIKESDVKYICLNCSLELYSEGTRGPRSIRATCPKCGEVFDVWL